MTLVVKVAVASADLESLEYICMTPGLTFPFGNDSEGVLYS